MSNSKSGSLVDRAPYLRPIRNDGTPPVERNRLLLAINEADQLGFEATRNALIELLRQHESRGKCSDSSFRSY